MAVGLRRAPREIDDATGRESPGPLRYEKTQFKALGMQDQLI